MNSLSYDTCAYSKALSQSVAPLQYMLDTVKYEHCDQCRMELGVVGGTAVSHVGGNLIDLENNLFGIDRPSTKCPSYQHLPTPPGEPIRGKEYIKPVQHPAVDTRLHHLPACQLQSFPATPQPPPLNLFSCDGAGAGAASSGAPMPYAWGAGPA